MYFGPIGYVPTVSFVLYMSAISVVIQAITYISIGAFADYGRWRFTLLMSLSIAGSLIAMTFLAVTEPKLYWFGALLMVLGNVCYGCTLIFYNSYLPVLVRNHPMIKGRIEEWVNMETGAEQELSLLGISKRMRQLTRKTKANWNHLVTHAKLRYFPTGSSGEKQPDNHSTEATPSPTSSEPAAAASSSSSASTIEDPTSTAVTPIPFIAVYPPSMVDEIAPRTNRLGSAPIDMASITKRFQEPSLLRRAHSLPDAPDSASAISDFTRSRVKLQTKLEDRLANTLSTHGLASGQVGILIMLGLAGGITVVLGDREQGVLAMKVVVAMVGVWWFLFSMITWKYLQVRPGPSMPKNMGNPVFFSWKKSECLGVLRLIFSFLPLALLIL